MKGSTVDARMRALADLQAQHSESWELSQRQFEVKEKELHNAISLLSTELEAARNQVWDCAVIKSHKDIIFLVLDTVTQ